MRVVQRPVQLRPSLLILLLLALTGAALANGLDAPSAGALGPKSSSTSPAMFVAPFDEPRDPRTSATTDFVPDGSCADALGVRCEPAPSAIRSTPTLRTGAAVRSTPTVASLPSPQGPLGDSRTRVGFVLLLATAAALLWVACSVTSPKPKGRRAARVSKWTVSALEVFIVACVVTAGVSLVVSSRAREQTPPAPVPLGGTHSIDDPLSVPSVVAKAIGGGVHVFDRPSKRAVVIATFENPWRVNGDPFVPLPLVFGVQRVSDGWVQVLLPTRPNGATGWIRRAEVSLSGTPYRVLVEIGLRRLTVFRDDTVIVRDTVAVGAPASPTPTGHFYIRAVLQAPSPDTVYGPFALALSGFSPTLASFNGGDGELGIHGNNDSQSLGRDVTHGCIRVSNPIIRTIASALPLGVPVEIVN